MTNFRKKQYKQIAEVVLNNTASVDPHAYTTEVLNFIREKLCRAFCKLFKSDNPKFNEKTFREACGLDQNSKDDTATRLANALDQRNTLKGDPNETKANFTIAGDEEDQAF